jgi:hypothetical protein
MESIKKTTLFFFTVLIIINSLLIGSFYTIVFIISTNHKFSIMVWLFENLYVYVLITLFCLGCSMFIGNKMLKIISVTVGLLGVVSYFLLAHVTHPH